MATTTGTRGRSPGKTALAAVLAILGVLAIIAGIIYFTEPARSLPSVLGTITSPPARANDIRPLRGLGAVIVGVILLIAAGFAGRAGRSSPQRQDGDPAGRVTAG
jgi:uncharacterized membrane protein YidH (DUF202 family)